MSIARESVPRFIYNSIKKKYYLRLQIERLGVWFIFVLFFLGIMYYGSIELDNQDVFYFREHATPFFQKAYRTAIVIISTIVLILFTTSILLLMAFLHKQWKHKLTLHHNIWLQTIRIADNAISMVISWIPILLSAIPPFITAIFFILWFRLDTLQTPHFFYAILCLVLFNLPYSYSRSHRKIQQAYQSPAVLFAQSIGIPPSTIFLHYVIPEIVRDYCTMLRELLPHLLIESVILEYTFGYNALMRSTIDAIQQGSWHYCFLCIYGLALFISFFDLFFHTLENFFDRPKYETP